MNEAGLVKLEAHFSSLADPRIDRTKRHPLINIIMIAICAVICGAEKWVGIQAYGEAKREWLGRFLDLTNGIPSHDTFGRVFALLDPKQFEACFLSWIKDVFTVTRHPTPHSPPPPVHTIARSA